MRSAPRRFSWGLLSGSSRSDPGVAEPDGSRYARGVLPGAAPRSDAQLRGGCVPRRGGFPGGCCRAQADRIQVSLNLMVLVTLAVCFLGPLLDQMHNYVGDAFRAAAVFLGVVVGLKQIGSRCR